MRFFGARHSRRRARPLEPVRGPFEVELGGQLRKNPHLTRTTRTAVDGLPKAVGRHRPSHEHGLVSLAAMNRNLAQSNKPRTRVRDT